MEEATDVLLQRLPLLVLLLPLIGFVVLALFGDAIRDEEVEAKRSGGSGLAWRLRAEGTRAAMLIACMMVLAAFAISVWSVVRLLALPQAFELRFEPSLKAFDWIAVGNLTVPFSLLLDPLSSVMILVVSGIGSLIHIYSLGYMSHDEERVRYFSYLNLFLFFMLLLVLGGSLPVMFVGWEGVGLCSYLLIGFWFKKQSASAAGLKAFVVNRIGDAGLILGTILAFQSFGVVDFTSLRRAAAELRPEALGEFGTVTVICLLLFVGACGKSAQIPLHVWLPDAMEGPTPVSALIHAATMVTAGVYMVVRLSSLFILSPTAMAVIATIGAATALMAATVALVQTDIKKVLAYSTVSQLGYMFLACGVGAFGVAVFHLFTHAFFKALLFLGSGSVIHALSGEQDMRQMGGLSSKIRWTFVTFLIGTLAIAGIPPLAGFFSKDAILGAAFEQHRPVLFGIGLATAILTAFYMTRLLLLTFFGKFRGSHEAEHHIHESPASMLFPLVVLALGSIGVGFIDIPHILEPVLPHAEHGAHPDWLPYLATISAILGIVAAYYAYVMFTDLPARVGAALRPLQRIFEAKWGFDTLFNWFAARVVVQGSERTLWRRVDAGWIDGTVNGVAHFMDMWSRSTRGLQSGLVRGYALLIFGGAVVLLSYLLWVQPA
jgi:NADH-quinone oxidoreductase subunit L